MRLNLIGNGFDLYHGLPSSYYYFGCYLASKYPDFYFEMADMYGFQCQNQSRFGEFEIVVCDIFWNAFEENLGELDSTWMEYRLCDDLGLECDDPIDIDIPESSNSIVIKEKFCEWVCATLNTRSNFRLVKSNISNSFFKFGADDVFVNFNYTQTLEEVYKIPSYRIYHIHGECGLDSNWGNLIVGHGNDKGIQYLEDSISRREKDCYWLGEQSARNRLNEEKCELGILQDLKKDVPALCSELIRFLLAQKETVDEIRILGLSCGSVDEPYIESLHERFPDAKWSFSYYNSVERKKRISFSNKLGIINAQYFEFVNPTSSDIMKKIVKRNQIPEFKRV